METLFSSLQGDDINIDGSELLYMNEHETIKIDLSMNRRGAKQVVVLRSRVKF